MCVSAGGCGGQKRAIECSTAAGAIGVVSGPAWVLGTELVPSARAVKALTSEPPLQPQSLMIYYDISASSGSSFSETSLHD